VSGPTSWMSSIPPHWSKKKLKYVASLKSGDSITSDSITESGEYPVFGGNGIRGYTAAYTHSGKYVLIGRQGALCGNINYASGCFWASEHAVVVDIKGEDEVVWLGELLRSMDLNQYSQSAAQPGIAVDVIANLEIPVPPLIEQRAIADYLDRETARLDGLVAAKERVLGLLAEKRRALITRAVTLGLDPRSLFRDSGIPWLGEIPAHWATTRLKYVAEVQGGLTVGMNYGTTALVEYPYLRVANVQDGYLDLSDVATILFPEAEAESCLLAAGDVLMNEGGDADKLGRGCIWAGEIAPCLHQNHVFAVRPRLVHSEWLNAWTSTEVAKAFFESRAKQSTNLASISATNIKELPIPIHPVEEQSAIVAHIGGGTAKLDALRTSTERTIALLKERRAALIAAAVTGRLDVQGAERHIAVVAD
jgi:type I restriction enzyme, S subunit